jgi:hypothetical protein
MSSVPESECRKHGAQPGGRGPARDKTMRAKTEKNAETETARRPPSPYTVHNLDTAIAHLEVAMGADKAMAIFGSSYWHERVLELRATPGILDIQERRLRCLMARFAVTG